MQITLIRNNKKQIIMINRYNKLISRLLPFLVLTILAFSSCKKKDPKIEERLNNDAPYYDKIPRVKIENYVNRLFIDIIGREPFDSEMKAETDNLIANNLALITREALILKLQTDQTYRAGDSSYAIAASNRIYDLMSTRLCEGFTSNDFKEEYGPSQFARLSDSLAGNWAGFYANKANSEAILAAINVRWKWYHKQITIEDYCTILINNIVTFEKTDSYMGNEDNTIKYTFNDLLFRQYTVDEFNVSRDMILMGKSGILFGKTGHSKGDYMYILTHSNEFYEGTVKWLYKTFLVRLPSTEELVPLMATLPVDKDIIKIQRNILKTDEYANF
jgi:hypothetical protein